MLIFFNLEKIDLLWKWHLYIFRYRKYCDPMSLLIINNTFALYCIMYCISIPFSCHWKCRQKLWWIFLRIRVQVWISNIESRLCRCKNSQVGFVSAKDKHKFANQMLLDSTEHWQLIATTSDELLAKYRKFTTVRHKNYAHPHALRQSSVVITRSNIVRYCIDNYRNWDKHIN